MHSPFTFSPPESDTARRFLEDRANHAATLPPHAQLRFLKWNLDMARNLPIGADVSALDKSNVVITLQRWLDEVREAA